jgi:hypothetical protein
MKITHYLLVLLAGFSLLLPATGFAADTAELERQVQELARQLQELKAQLANQHHEIESNVQRLSEHKRNLSRNREHLQEQEEKLEKTLTEQESITRFAERLKNINERVKISGLVEVEAGFSRDYDDHNESDITLATAALDIDVDLHKYVNAHIMFLWEEDDTEPVDIDEGYIVIGNTESFPLYVQAGKLYVPFGNFESNMISDPLTLEIGETRETAVVCGGEYEGFHASTYAFNGDVDESGDDDQIKCFGLEAGYTFENETFGFDVGAGWMNNLADSDTLGDTLPSEIEDYVDGITAHAIFTWQGFRLIGEYLGALDDFKAAELEFKGKGAEPEAWNIELGYTFEIASHETVFAIAYQGTDEALALELPEERYLGTAGVGLIDGLSLALEYAHDKDYDKKEGGTGDSADTLTLQMALEF